MIASHKQLQFTMSNDSEKYSFRLEKQNYFRHLFKKPIFIKNKLVANNFKIVPISGRSFHFNPFSANFTKWSNTLKQFVGNLPTNCLSVFDKFVGLALKGLTLVRNAYK